MQTRQFCYSLKSIVGPGVVRSDQSSHPANLWMCLCHFLLAKVSSQVAALHQALTLLALLVVMNTSSDPLTLVSEVELPCSRSRESGVGVEPSTLLMLGPALFSLRWELVVLVLLFAGRIYQVGEQLVKKHSTVEVWW